MSVFGLTGNFASGKSEMLRRLKAKGAKVFEADKKIHSYYQDKTSAVFKRIASLFPKTIKKGKVCRRSLAKSVFADTVKLKKLERIVHPLVIKELKQWAKLNKPKKGVFIAEVPLLFEKKLGAHFDKIILVKTEKEKIIKRANKKHLISRAEVLKRLSLYIPVREKIKRSDFIVNNSSSLKKLEKEVDLLWEKIRKR